MNILLIFFGEVEKKYLCCFLHDYCADGACDDVLMNWSYVDEYDHEKYEKSYLCVRLE